jgi:alpha-ketoglutarate-dependent taurine dioxygenase
MLPLEDGFAILDTPIRGLADISEAAMALARRFGPLVRGRYGRLVEEVTPATSDEARPRSLSQKYGTEALPLHMDTAHRLRPARIMVLGCVDVGLSEASTILLDVRSLNWSSAELHLLRTAVFLIRTGRRSFYCSIMSDRRHFTRFDPGCMEPTDELSEAALQLFTDRLSRTQSQKVDWLEGRFLVLDNWRMLHGRTAASDKSRRLLVRSCAQ